MITGDYHLHDLVLRAYAEDRLGDADAWSVEAHLDHCPACRARLTPDEQLAQRIAGFGANLRANLPRQGRIRSGSRWRQVAVLVGAGPAARLGWLGSVAATAGLLVALAASPAPTRSWLLLVAPALPVLGIAASYGLRADPLHELVAATPYAGLRIVLWRCLSVLAATAPVALAAGEVSGIGVPVLWLLPCLALTALTLGLGTLLEIGQAAAAVVAGWAAVVLAPVGREWAGTVLAPVGKAWLVTPQTSLAWAAVTVFGGALAFWRRDRMEIGVRR
ncbi:Putative zinc-finger [Micromonospora viridifaciens]|uniref:Putative zinc-finger n=1 Tax=Micromonospora viridifaciens TaxID=1881 RepID=A0A1C4YJ30_MICVI|nr:zf-HC2 domain-containing protein [Micromonospora viridifaciens]SCF20753.1 Putative zinc-finger [Micromonospora viridifaciens]